MSHNCRQSPLKALLHNYEKHHKSHNMMMRHESQNMMYDDAKDRPAPPDPASLKQTSPMHSILEEEGEATAKCSEDPQPQKDIQGWLTQLEPTTNSPTHVEELAHLINKLHKLAIVPQLCPPSRALKETLHTALQK